MSLKDVREKRGYTQPELAEKVGVSQSLISQMEQGKKNGSVSTNMKLATFLGVSVEAILHGPKFTQSNNEKQEAKR
ncbi:helix-turn-helix transcriptional regulator [Lacticaseibacillus manihotivorans]|uniref:helix-turn-helix transcriptional regulator n=1 Tax=Lacticaseibacillus manihotivorans TaxID=88233 RepID=UPI00192D1306|nr:helix-turn-helix transcriptional regulator [Lacticaseibacillus manihotivorans]